MSSIYRRGKTYHARAQRNGREIRRSLKTTNRAIAEKRFRDWLQELDAVAWGDKPRQSYAAAEEKFIRERLPQIKAKSAQRYGVSLKRLATHFGDKNLDQITSAELSAFETARHRDGVSNTTIILDFACLSSLLTACEDWEWIDVNPVPPYLRRRARHGLKVGDARTRYLTEAEEAALLAAASNEVRQTVILDIETGLRREELYSLQWWQIETERGWIKTTTKTKSGKLRVVPLTARARAVLDELPRYDGVPYVLVNGATKRRYSSQDKALKNAAARGGIADLRFHDLRRTAGCRWLQRDRRSMEEVSIMLGHASIKVTERHYAFLDAERVASEIARTKTGTAHT